MDGVVVVIVVLDRSKNRIPPCCSQRDLSDLICLLSPAGCRFLPCLHSRFCTFAWSLEACDAVGETQMPAIAAMELFLVVALTYKVQQQVPAVPTTNRGLRNGWYVGLYISWCESILPAGIRKGCGILHHHIGSDCSFGLVLL